MSLHENSEFSLLQGKMSCPTFCLISACSLLWNRRVHNDYQLKCPQSLYVLTLSSWISELLAICVYNISRVQNVNTFGVQKFHPSCQTGSLKASCKSSEIDKDRKEWLLLSYFHLFFEQNNNYIWDFVISVFS